VKRLPLLLLGSLVVAGFPAMIVAQSPVKPAEITVPQTNWNPPPARFPAVRGSGPVVAGPTAVQPAGTNDPLPVPQLPNVTPPSVAPSSVTLPSPSPVPFTPAPTRPAPTVILETTPAPRPAEPRPLTLGTAPPAVAPPSGGAGPVPASNLPVKQTAGITVETVAPDSVSVGQDVTYELFVKNEGGSAVWNVRVDDELPAGTRYVSSDPPGDAANGRLSWSLGALDAGATKRLKVTVRPADEGEIRNRTVVTFSAATENRMRVTRPKLTTSLSAPESVKAGEEVSLLIRLTNTGSGPATNLVIKASLSDGLHNPNGSVLELKLPTLAAGQVKTIPLRAIATKAGPQACALIVSADGTATEPSKAGFTVVEPKLTARVVGPAKSNVKSEPTYTVEFTNPGTAATDAVTATATLPSGFEFLAASDGGTLAANGRDVNWKLAGIPAGAGKAVSVKVKAVAPADAVLTVAANTTGEPAVMTAGVQPASVASRGLEVKSELAIKAEGVPALRFEVVDVEDPVELGKEAIYEIKIANQGTGPCTNVTIAAFPAEGTTAVASNGPTTVRVQAGSLLFDPIAKLDVKGEVVYRVRVRGVQPGDMKFKVQVSCDQIRTPIVKEENTRFVKE
jgi:uncharacterized repeat protein (TIGR01451 family)